MFCPKCFRLIDSFGSYLVPALCQALWRQAVSEPRVHAAGGMALVLMVMWGLMSCCRDKNSRAAGLSVYALRDSLPEKVYI